MPLLYYKESYQHRLEHGQVELGDRVVARPSNESIVRYVNAGEPIGIDAYWLIRCFLSRYLVATVVELHRYI
jgi:hypothetical protein